MTRRAKGGPCQIGRPLFSSGVATDGGHVLLKPRVRDVDHSAEKRRKTLQLIVAHRVISDLEGEEPRRLPVDDPGDGTVVLGALGAIGRACTLEQRIKLRIGVIRERDRAARMEQRIHYWHWIR